MVSLLIPNIALLRPGEAYAAEPEQLAFSRLLLTPLLSLC